MLPMAETEKKSAKKEKKQTFEEAVARLNEIVAALEDGSAPLDRSLALYEEGIALVRFCNEALDTAERRIKVLTRNEAGEVVEADFVPGASPASET